MARIIRELPYLEQPADIQIRGRSIRVKRDQIILWISVAEQGLAKIDPRTPRIPAILDTGCNHNLLISQQHLASWSGIHPDHFPKLANIRVGDRLVSQVAANVWLHPNVGGTMDRLAFGPSFLLELTPGIAVHPAKQGEPPHPRLPLLGLRAFQRAGLRISIDCDRRRVNIRSRRFSWFWS